MSEEEAKEIVDTIKKEEFPYALAIAKAYEKLEKELQDSNRIAVERRDHILILKQKLDFALKDVSSLKKQKRELEEEILKILEGKQKHIEQLRKRNKELKEILENNSKINVADHKYASEMEDKYLDEHNILTEFEKWLEEQIKKMKQIGKVMKSDIFVTKDLEHTLSIKVLESALDKLQELKERKNEKIQ